MSRDRVIPHVQCGKLHSCICDSRGGVWTSGDNKYSVLGIAVEHELLKNNKFEKVVIDKRVLSVFANQEPFTFILDEHGKLSFNGNNSSKYVLPFHPKNIKDFTEVSHMNHLKIKKFFSYWDVFIIDENDDVYCFGNNRYGSLGIGTKKVVKSSKPGKVVIPGGKKIQSISCGCRQTMFVTTDGQVYSAGRNHIGQLLLGHTRDRTRPTPVRINRSINNLGVKQAFSGHDHHVFLAADGNCYSGGYNKEGQLGLNDHRNRKFAELIPSLQDKTIIQIKCGRTHSVFLTNNNECYMCGCNIYGTISSKKAASIAVPTKLETDLQIVNVFCGFQFSIFQTIDGELYGSGRNSEGQLGLGHYGDKIPILTKIEFDLCAEEKSRGERFEYVVDNEDKFEQSLLKFRNNNEFQVIRTILIEPGQLTKDVIDVNIELLGRFDKELLYTLVFAQDEHKLRFSLEQLKNLFWLYKMCFSLKLTNLEFLILKKIEEIESLEVLVELFEYTYSFSTKENSANVVLSPFNTQLFNVFKKRIREFEGKYFEKVIEKLDLLTYLKKEFVISPIEKSVLFWGKVLQTSFYSRVYDWLSNLWENVEKSFNFVIVSKDKKEIKCHKEVLILESDYFFRVIKFGAIETRKEGYLILDRLNYEQLKIVVEYIYTKSIKATPEQFVCCLKILCEIIPYDERAFEESLMEKIISLSEKLVESESFIDQLENVAHLFHYEWVGLPKKHRSALKRSWENVLGEKIVREVIETTITKRIAQLEIAEVFRNVEDKIVKKQTVDELETKVKALEEENSKEKDEKRVVMEKINVMEDRQKKLERENMELKKENDTVKERLKKLEEIVFKSENEEKESENIE